MYANVLDFIHRAILAALFFAVTASVSLAQPTGAPESLAMDQSAPVESLDVTTVKLGLGALALPDFEGSKDYSVLPVPLVEIENWHRFSLSLRGLSYLLYHVENDAKSPFRKIEFSIQPILGPSASRKEDNDFLFLSRGANRYLRGLGVVDTGLDVGTDVLFRTGPVRTRLSLRQEVAGGHDGLTAELGVGTRAPLSNRTWLGLEAATTWADDDYMDAFFSIDRTQAFRSIYRRYDANADFKDVSIALKLDHEFTEHVSLLAIARYARLLGDAAESPIVTGPGGSEDQFTALLGLTYTWSFGG